MKEATLNQAGKILELVAQKKVPNEQLQELLSSGLLSDLLDANIDQVDRDTFRMVVGLKPFNAYAKIKPIHNVIDCNADPYVLIGYQIVEHRKGGRINWDTVKIFLYLSKNQKGEKTIQGNKLHKELENMSVLNANVLNYLLANQHLIPEEWKDKDVFFWGTIYQNSAGELGVRCLEWEGIRWTWGFGRLDFDWSSDNPAILLAK